MKIIIYILILVSVLFSDPIPKSSQFLGNKERGVGVEVTSSGDINLLPLSTVGKITGVPSSQSLTDSLNTLESRTITRLDSALLNIKTNKITLENSGYIENTDTDTMYYVATNHKFVGKITSIYDIITDYDLTNTFLGYNTGLYLTSGDSNTFVGHRAGQDNLAGNINTFIGLKAGYDNTNGNANTFIGNNSGEHNLTGNNNTFLGAYSGRYNTSGITNIFLGLNSGRSNIDGSSNIAIGKEAGYLNTASDFNINLGYEAGYNNTGGSNIFIGKESGDKCTTGDNNIALGICNFSGHRDSTIISSNNIVIGNHSAYNLTKGEYNILIGDSVQITPTNTDSLLAIGLGSNQLITGNMTTGSDRNVTIDGHIHSKADIATFARDSAYIIAAPNVWYILPFKDIHSPYNSEHFNYNADSTGIVVTNGTNIVLQAHAKIFTEWEGGNSACGKYGRFVIGKPAGRSYSRFGQYSDKITKTPLDQKSIILDTPMYISSGDTVFVQVRVTDTDLKIQPHYTPFENVITGGLVLEYKGTW